MFTRRFVGGFMPLLLLLFSMNGVASELVVPLLHFDDEQGEFTANEPSKVWLTNDADVDAASELVRSVVSAAQPDCQFLPLIRDTYSWLYDDVRFGWLHGCPWASESRLYHTERFVSSALIALSAKLSQRVS